ncbi:MAG: LacI family DNA-binding transcriptional regulator [Clostridia bacterium]|nr:LacI family DNA-binding transcriptional regulator [Clostridia bacterium]
MEKRTTIYDIARKLGISTATVNRALTGKPKVKAETRALVLKTAAEMGFKPNALARSLARGRLRLAVIGFTSFPEFHDQFLQGAMNAGEELQDYNVEVVYYGYNQGATNTEEAEAFLDDTIYAIAEGGFDGVLALARDSKSFGVFKERGICLATAVNDINAEMRRFHVCYNGFVAGRIAAELIYRFMPDHSLPVAIASGFEGMGVHDRMVSGFKEQMKTMPLNLYTICYNKDNEEIAYENTLRLLEECPNLGAIYVNSYNSANVIRAVREKGLAGKILLITSDINDELRSCIADGTVAASIFQNQHEQGRLGVHKLFNLLVNNEDLPDTHTIKPRIIFNSNLSIF